MMAIDGISVGKTKQTKKQIITVHEVLNIIAFLVPLSLSVQLLKKKVNKSVGIMTMFPIVFEVSFENPALTS